MTPDEAKAALDSVCNTKEKMAARMQWPWWRHAIFGFLLSLMLAAIVLPAGMQMWIWAVALAILFLTVRDDKRRHGMFVSGYQKGRTIWVLLATAVLFVAGLMAIQTYAPDGPQDAMFWMLLAVVFAGSTALSYLWQVVYQADLRKGAA